MRARVLGPRKSKLSSSCAPRWRAPRLQMLRGLRPGYLCPTALAGKPAASQAALVDQAHHEDQRAVEQRRRDHRGANVFLSDGDGAKRARDREQHAEQVPPMAGDRHVEHPADEGRDRDQRARTSAGHPRRTPSCRCAAARLVRLARPGTLGALATLHSFGGLGRLRFDRLEGGVGHDDHVKARTRRGTRATRLISFGFPDRAADRRVRRRPATQRYCYWSRTWLTRSAEWSRSSTVVSFI